MLMAVGVRLGALNSYKNSNNIQCIIYNINMRILGIDPGLGICGFGLIETSTRASARALDFGAVTTKVDAPIPMRLLELHE